MRNFPILFTVNQSQLSKEGSKVATNVWFPVSSVYSSHPPSNPTGHKKHLDFEEF